MTEFEPLRKHLRAYIHLTCHLLLDEVDSVSVSYWVGPRTTVFEIRSSKVGAILGKKGRLVQAMRELVKASANRHRFACVIEIIED